ncbi:MAG: YqgE/AlgH family protein [Actinobacteria bacterium]|nr:YqgE/AlgH family protein [Actinomycetota bacterium]
MADLVKGRLLVATPELEDPNFFRTVMLMLDHTEEGALGVVLNRPTTASVSEPLPEWASIAAEPAVVFVGGPVQPEAAIGIGRRAGTGEPDGFATLFGELGTVDLERPPTAVAPPVDRLRVFAGYAGWAPGQLERELAADGWFVVESDAADPWSDAPTDLWRRVLRRQRGQLRVFADFPMDPQAN